MRYTLKYKKEVAQEMRKKGFSYSQICASISIPRSTIIHWVRGIKLTQIQVQKLITRRLETARKNSLLRKRRTVETIAKIKASSAGDIVRISKRELWLMGIMLYWRENILKRSEVATARGVSFSSSDPSIIKFFLKWLFEVGGLEKKEIRFDIFLRRDAQRSLAMEAQKLRTHSIEYWADIVDFPHDSFNHIYFQKVYTSPERGRKLRKRAESGKFGFLRIRVRASSLLARQISGWIEGIQKNY